MIDLATTSKQFLRIDELTAIFDVSRRTVYHWIARGKIHSVLIGGSRRVPIADARRFAVGNNAQTAASGLEVCKSATDCTAAS